MPIAFTIDVPSPADAEAIARVRDAGWLAAYPNEENGVTKEYILTCIAARSTPAGLDKQRAWIEKLIYAPDAFLRVATNDKGQIVGFIVGSKKGNECELQGLYILEAVYGTGVAQGLWLSFLEWSGSDNITLDVATYNKRAIAFYNKLGFVEQPGTERLFKTTPIPIITMKRNGEK